MPSRVFLLGQGRAQHNNGGAGGQKGREGQGRAEQGRQSRAGQGRAGQGRAGQGRAGQGRAGQGRAGQGQSRKGKRVQGKKVCREIARKRQHLATRLCRIQAYLNCRAGQGGQDSAGRGRVFGLERKAPSPPIPPSKSHFGGSAPGHSARLVTLLRDQHWFRGERVRVRYGRAFRDRLRGASAANPH